MNIFSISQISRYSGIKAHTIRIWEQRYHALQPGRSEGNTRYYDNRQLRRLLNIVSLAGRGHRISALCEMPDKKLFRLINETIAKDVEPSTGESYYVNQLIAAGMAFDEIHFDKILSSCLLRWGWKKTYAGVIQPMLERVGIMWAGDTIPPANEHFISNMIRQKLFMAIDSLRPYNPGSGSWLLFLREGECHELGLLFACFMLRSAGHRVIYLGPDMPFDSLTNSVETLKPDFLLLFLVHGEDPESVNEYLDQLKQRFSGKKIFVAGNEAVISQLNTGKKLQCLVSVDELDKILRAIPSENPNR